MAVLSNAKQKIRSPSDLRDAEVLEAEHEVDDTRLVLHVIHCGAFYYSIVVRAKDTDILLLLVHHYPRFNNRCVWMMSGTANAVRYYSVHTIYRNLPESMSNHLMAFHCSTGCGHINSYVFNQSKHGLYSKRMQIF